MFLYQIKCDVKDFKHSYVIINFIIYFCCFSILLIKKNIEVKEYNLTNIEEILKLKASDLPVLTSDTNNIIVFNNTLNNEIKDKKRSFWDLIKN